MAFYLALHANRHPKTSYNTMRQNRYVCNSQEDNYFIFQFVSKSYMTRLAKSNSTDGALKTRFEESLPLMVGVIDSFAADFTVGFKVTLTCHSLAEYN